MKASDVIVSFFAHHGVRYCFELAGGMITHLLDSMDTHKQMTLVPMHHEQAAAFAAEGVARFLKGQIPGLALGTSGPGATNLITGIGSCWFDSVPCFFITGQVNVDELKGNLPIRQQGFQELDIISLVSPITKHARQVQEISQLLPELHKSFSLMMSGRKGPVLLDIPNNIQRMEIPDSELEEWLAKPLLIYDTEETPVPDLNDLSTLHALCKESKRPLICFGGGSRWSPLLDDWLKEIISNNIPHVSTLMGHERIPANPLYCNMLGTYGNREANWAVQNCDLLIVLGARLDIRQTGADTDDFARKAKIVQVDIDPGQLDNRVKTTLKICCSMDRFFEKFPIKADLFTGMDIVWIEELQQKKKVSNFDEYPDIAISPYKIFNALNTTMTQLPVNYVCDVGSHQMWAAQGLRLFKNQAVHYSGGMGAMGFALPAAIGISIISKEKTIVITGDGGLQINIQELDTIKKLNLNIAIIVLNNCALGMVKNFQDMYFEGRDYSTKSGYSCPPFEKIAESYGISSLTVTDINSLKQVMVEIRQTTGPLLVNIFMKNTFECRPRLIFGNQLDRQIPELLNQ